MTFIIQAWCGYQGYVESVTHGKENLSLKGIEYWRNEIFKNFVLFSLPVFILAILVRITLATLNGQPYNNIFETCVAILIGFVALNRNIKLNLRKGIVMLLLYFSAVVVLSSLDPFGPGALFLLVTTVFATLTLSANLGYISVALHILIGLVFAFLIHTDEFETPLSKRYTLGSWIYFSANLSFLSLICVVVITKVVNGLEGTILQDSRVKTHLKYQADRHAYLHHQLIESGNNYECLFVQNPSPMWVMSIETYDFLQVNDAAVETYGYTINEFLSLNVKDLRLACDPAIINNTLGDQIKPGNRYSYMTRHLKKDKKILDVEISCRSINVNGKQALLAISRDITEQQIYIKAIEAQNERFRKIAYIQSHVVRAPLARIMGLIGLIKLDMDEKPNPEIIQYMDSSTQELDLIIQSITDYSGNA